MPHRTHLRWTWIVSMALTAAVVAEDWPNWRGPNQNGVSNEKGFATNWNGQPKVLWRGKVGQGYSSFAVAGGRVYTLGWFNGQDSVHCLDAQTGQPVWAHSYPCSKVDKYHPGGPGCTPTVHDGRVYTLSKEAHFFCLDANTGKVLWQKDLKRELGAAMPTWGFSSSPVIEENKVIVDVGPIAAFDRLSGSLLWKTRAMPAAYGTPVVFAHQGKRMAAGFNAQGLVILDTADGREIGAYPWKTQYDVNASAPIVAGDHIFISSGYGHGATLVRLTGGTPQSVWENKELRNQMNPSVIVGGHIYGMDGNTGQNGPLVCLDLQTGKPVWKQPAFGAGALIAADGKLIAMTEKGELVIAEASPAGFKPLARGQVLGGTCWSAPILANGRIYCRNDKGDVVCVDVKPR